jgi:hypothetical protein
MNLLKDQEFIKGVISICSVAFLISIFELVLYYTTVKSTFVNGINSLVEMVNVNVDIEVINIIKGISENDENTGDYINNLKLAFYIMFLLFILSIILYFINLLKIYKLTHRTYKGMYPVYISIFGIFIILMLFQIIILEISKKFNFGNIDELKLRFINSLIVSRNGEKIKIPDGNALF